LIYVKNRRAFYIKNKKGGTDKMEVNYNVVFVNKNNVIIEEKKLEDIIAKKLLRVILANENINSVALNNS
jgi:hypothetical protein